MSEDVKKSDSKDNREEPKQIIVIRRDLGMRRGKEIAQGAHAAMAWLMRRMTSQDGMTFEIRLEPEEMVWCQGLFRKVVCQVANEAELMAVYERAKAAGLEASLIEDSGLTEFHGQTTATAVAIGPHFDWAMDPVTKDLKLY